MPMWVFWMRSSPGAGVGTGSVVLYWRTEVSPVWEIRTPDMVLGMGGEEEEEAMVRVRGWGGRWEWVVGVRGRGNSRGFSLVRRRDVRGMPLRAEEIVP